MIAALCNAYGDPDLLRLAEMRTPVAKDDEIRIRVVATTVTSGDARIRSRRMPKGFGLLAGAVFGFSRPRQPILGTELAGIVDQVGKKVTNFALGDEVFAFVGLPMACHAEYRTLKATAAIARKPTSLTWNETAAMSFGGSTVLSFFRRARLKSGETLLVNGASGSVGSAAVQIAKAQGAIVHAVCSARNADLVRSLGADLAIDYKTTDILSLPPLYDAILDAVGNAPYRLARKILKSNGRLMSVVSTLPELLRMPWETARTCQSIVAGPASESPVDLAELARLANHNQYRPVIDEIYPLAFIGEAHRRVDTGHKRGNVVVQVSEP